MAISTDQSQAAQWQPKQQAGQAEIRIHPTAANGFSDGEIIEVQSEQGSLQMIVRFNENQRPDLALMDKGGWLSKGRCANSIIAAEASDEGGCAVYYDTPVRLDKPQ